MRVRDLTTGKFYSLGDFKGKGENRGDVVLTYYTSCSDGSGLMAHQVRVRLGINHYPDRIEIREKEGDHDTLNVEVSAEQGLEELKRLHIELGAFIQQAEQEFSQASRRQQILLDLNNLEICDL